MKKYNIIMFNMSKYSDWVDSGVVNRNYHILHTLAKDERINKIIAVDFFAISFKNLLKTFLVDHLKKSRRGEVVFGNLSNQAWQISSKIIVFSSLSYLFKPQKIIRDLQTIIKEQGMTDNLISWSFNPYFTRHFGQLGQKLDIFDAVDNWTVHSTHKKHKNLLLKNYEIIKEEADLIYTVSKDLAEFLQTSKTKWLPNAVDFDHFQTNETMASLSELPKPIIGFLGVLQNRIDIDLLKLIAEKHNDKTLVLAGPIWKKQFPKYELDKFDNVIFTGPVRYEDIPKYYNSFDVGIIPYKENEFIRSTNSMKYYEYLAAGLPVVSTPSGGIEKFKNIIYVAQNHQDFIRYIDEAISTNNDDIIKERKDFVKNMTWQKRLETVFKDIEEKTQSSTEI